MSINGCVFCEGEFNGLSNENLESSVDAFFLTLPNSEKGFTETVKSIGQIYKYIETPGSKLSIARTYQDLQKASKQDKKSLILTFQEPYPIGNSLGNLHVFYQLGVRVVQLTYNKANFIGSGCTEYVDRGLTDFGKTLIKEMNRIGMLIDLSHCGHLTTLEAIQASEQPVICSHANVQQLCSNPRNKTDEVVKMIAEKGGVIGLTPWGPLCWNDKTGLQPSLDDYLDHVEYVINLVGIEHVGFGSDDTLDGATDEEGTIAQAYLYPTVVANYNERVGTDPKLRHAKGSKDINNVINGLRNRGYSSNDIAQFLGGNFSRVIQQVWKEV
ncbi:dipeptidase [Ornithinibacillus californiensis]|uniref:dipeptidase n=1 Tax=Ornithinibacillus californiensis TaxID=161536 RepID=UPI00064D8B2C|nr:membrane dipeptidase [Ornithinibacillus californiensis]